MRTPLPGRFFYEVPEHQPLLKKWMTGLGGDDIRDLVLKKYRAHHEAFRSHSIWSTIRNTLLPREPNPWQYGAELLEWGLHQPWASSIDIPAVIDAFTVRYTHDGRPQAWRTLPSRIPEPFRQKVAQAVAEKRLLTSSLLSSDSILEALQEWSVLYNTAYPNDIPADVDMNWRTMCAQTLYRHSDGWSNTDPKKIQAIHEQGEWLTNQLAPEMLNNPTPIWRTAIRYLHPQVWIQEANTIRTVYGTDEKQLAYKLPYMGNSSDAGIVHQRLVETFCPTVYPTLQVLLSPGDWADATKVICLIASMDPGKWEGPPRETPLPTLDHAPAS